jgi:protein-disulfide isomerase
MDKMAIPGAIVIAGVIVASAVFFTKNAENVKPTVVENEKPQIEITPITDQDHIRGNPDAEILIVEYSDLQCPACASFHGTMKRIQDEYIATGKVAWVYRHMPLDQIHESARGAAEASECVAKLGGEDKFWGFTDQVFANQTENVKAEKMAEIAVSLGVDKAQYETCVNERQTKDRVEKDYQDGLNIAKVDREFGTPYNIVVPKNGQQFPMMGAVPYAGLKQVIDGLLVNGSSEVK